MASAAIAAVLKHGRNIPFAEDWFLVPAITGNEPDLLAWAAIRNSEHLVAAPKLLFLGLLQIWGGDFRAVMVFLVVLLAAVAAAFLLTARRLRGGTTRVTDAFFPIVLLHLGHWDNFVWGWQIQFVFSTALTCILLLQVLAWPAGPPSVATAVSAGVAVVLLPLSGGNGGVLAPAFAFWLLYAGLAPRSGSARRDPVVRWVLTGSAAVSLAIVLTYLVGYERPSWNTAGPAPVTVARTAVKFVAFGFGPAAAQAWHVVAMLSVAAVLLSIGVVAVGVRVSRGGGRIRPASLLVLLGGFLLLAAAIGWGRGAKVESAGYMSPRYALLAVPLLCLTYLCGELYGIRNVGRIVRWGLFTAAVCLLPLNTALGLERRDWFERGFRNVESDLASGASLESIADRNYQFLLPWSRDALAARARMLQRACMGPFALAADDDREPCAHVAPARR